MYYMVEFCKISLFMLLILQVHCLEAERLSQDNVLVTVRDDLQCQQTSNSCLRDRISQLEQTESALLEYGLSFITFHNFH